MTTLKKKNQDIRKEMAGLTSQLEGLQQMNEQLEHMLKVSNDKCERHEQEISFLKKGSTGDSTQIQLQAAGTKVGYEKHQSIVTIDQNFIANASPDQLHALKKSVVEGPQNEMSMIDHLSVVMNDMRNIKLTS
jgi:hypothetical protein